MGSAMPVDALRDRVRWPAEGVARAPYLVFSDAEVYAREQATIFRGPAWHFLGIEAQIPERGDYVTSHIGDTPVIVARDHDGVVRAVVNRCAHKGTPLVLARRGRLERYMCVYHNWSYALDGRLESVAFERGVRGKGGMPPDFRKADHGLDPVRLHVICGLVFGTLDATTPDFESYVGPEHVANIRRVCGRPMTILGEYAQLLHSNWKLYMENVKDPYHASLLHAFNGVMKMDRLTMDGGIVMGARGWHHISYSKMTVDPGGEVYEKARELRSAEVSAYGFGLRDPSFTDVWDDYGDRVSLAVQTTFPTFVLQQLRNCLALRRVRPLGPDRTELNWIAFGYADDDARRHAGRLAQANMMGPAGLISMEDGMIGALVQGSVRGDPHRASVMEMGGRGIEAEAGSRASEGSVRGFWTGYRALTGL
jgi:anthranilate 1,2-dioxygenase large subunit/terephthalate 1,2-dioxygenase oxygenase component alpha subunit